ncbi:MAG TPA: hypothetical protein VFG12_12755 [Rhodopila sp.]|nr:hypothetical protein [Rhodopila sp.]
MARISIATIPVLAVLASALAAQANPPMAAPGDAQVKQLLLLMDRDQNGKVSRQEFMTFMAREFDRLDINKDGELDVNELVNLQVVPAKHPGGTGSR